MDMNTPAELSNLDSIGGGVSEIASSVHSIEVRMDLTITKLHSIGLGCATTDQTIPYCSLLIRSRKPPVVALGTPPLLYPSIIRFVLI